jgi:hypothetical protein
VTGTATNVATVYVGFTRSGALIDTLTAATVTSGQFSVSITDTVVSTQQIGVHYDAAGVAPLAYSSSFIPTGAAAGPGTSILFPIFVFSPFSSFSPLSLHTLFLSPLFLTFH